LSPICSNYKLSYSESAPRLAGRFEFQWGMIAMLKKLIALCIAVGLSLLAALAVAVEVNTADQAALESVKGIGPVHAKAIIDERTKNGPFKDADDLVARVKGIGPKSVKNLEAAGLTINGSTKPPSAAAGSAKSAATGASKPAQSGMPPATAPSSEKKKPKKGKAASAAAAS
jgi:competence protein ComEA